MTQQAIRTFVEVQDSVARAIQNGETWMTWRLLATGVIILAVLGILFVFLMEFRAINRSGGLKAYTRDMDTVNYSAVRSLWVFEVILGSGMVAVLLHAFVPKLVGEVQVEALVAVFTLAAAGRGINFGAFWAKRATEDPAIAATNAAIKDPSLIPLVTTNRRTGETTVSVMPATPTLPPEQPTTKTIETPIPAVVAQTPPPAPAQPAYAFDA